MIKINVYNIASVRFSANNIRYYASNEGGYFELTADSINLYKDINVTTIERIIHHKDVKVTSLIFKTALQII